MFDLDTSIRPKETMRWRLIRHVWGQHKWFEDMETGRIALCDDSGRHPGQADDGILWLAMDEPIVITIPDNRPMDEDGSPGMDNYSGGWVRIRVDEPDGEGGVERTSGGVGGDVDEWLWAAAEFGLPVEIRYESGRGGYRFQVTGHRIPGKGADLSLDTFGRRWPEIPHDKRCDTCGQPSGIYVCDHERLSDEDAREQGAVIEGDEEDADAA